MALAVSHRLSLRRHGFTPESIHVRFLVEMWPWDRFSAEIFVFPVYITLHRVSPLSYVKITKQICPSRIANLSPSDSLYLYSPSLKSVQIKFDIFSYS
jgi:hypothetical protein